MTLPLWRHSTIYLILTNIREERNTQENAWLKTNEIAGRTKNWFKSQAEIYAALMSKLYYTDFCLYCADALVRLLEVQQFIHKLLIATELKDAKTDWNFQTFRNPLPTPLFTW